jgi:hypothetical protein
MPHTTSDHCNVAITDHTTMVEQGGKTYCCTNCAAVHAGPSSTQAAMGTCAHCQVPIVDPSTRVEQQGMMFCCMNCAAAMPASTGRR